MLVVFSFLIVVLFHGAAPNDECGDIYLNSANTNIGQFKNCRTASSLHILGTGLTTLQPFRNLQEVIQNGDAPAIIIANNDKLRWRSGDLSNLTKVFMNRTILKTATISIYENPVLCIPSVDIQRLKKTSRGKDMGMDNTFIQECHCDMQFLLEQAANSGSSTSERCVVLSGDLHIDQSTSETLQNFTTNLHVIRGGLIMENSSWNSLRLPALDAIENSNGSAIDIAGNNDLQEISMPMLQSIKATRTYVSIRNNTILGMSHALKERILLTRLSTDVMPELIKVTIETTACIMDSTISPKLLKCSEIKGDITITGEISENRRKLEYLCGVQKLDGCLTIRGTKLEDLLFLRALKEVHCEKDRAPILIENNDFLNDVELGVHSVRSSYQRPIVIRSNKYLCRELVREWQALLKIVSNHSDHVSTINMVDGTHCGNRLNNDSTSTIVPVTFIFSIFFGGAFIALKSYRTKEL